MATLTYPTQHTNNSMYTYDTSRSSNCYYNVDSHSVVKLEPMEQTNDCSAAYKSFPMTDDYSSYKMNPMKQNKQSFTELNDNLLSWTTKHPENWTESEILDWVYFVADVQGFDGSKLRGEAYQNLSGSRLRNMSKEDFKNMDPDFGTIMYDIYRQLLGTGNFVAPTKHDNSTNQSPHVNDMSYHYEPEATPNADLLDFSVLIGGHLYDIDVESKMNMFPETEKIDHGYVSGGSEVEYEWHSVPSNNPYDWSGTDEDTNMMPLSMSQCSTASMFSKRRLPSGSLSSDEGDTMNCEPIESRPRQTKTKTPRSGGSKGNHLWEFVRDLLKDSTVNPSYLKWEDKSTGVFRFVNSEAIARLWGKKKNNKQMTYEKLSRAMRFCRTAGYFESIPKDGKFPKKLCFKFGPKAHGWQE